MPRVIVVLKPPKAHGAFITLARHIANCLSDASLFPSPTVPVPVLMAAIVTLEEAEANVLRLGQGAAADRNAKRAAVMGLLESERMYVQTLGNALPLEDALMLVAHSGFSAKKSSGYARGGFRARQGKESGSVYLAAPAEKVPTIYSWQWSSDGETWVDAPDTTHAHTTISGLTPGKDYHFRYRFKTGGVLHDWSDPIVFFVR
jgi:hypothetical protein